MRRNTLSYCVDILKTCKDEPLLISKICTATHINCQQLNITLDFLLDYKLIRVIINVEESKSLNVNNLRLIKQTKKYYKTTIKGVLFLKKYEELMRFLNYERT